VRLPFDTNVFVSALLFRNSWPSQAVRRATTLHTLLMSEPLWEEVVDVLHRARLQRYFTSEERDTFLSYLDSKAEWVSAIPRFEVCRDPKDNMSLDLAVSGNADCVVTSDKDLLVLDPFQGIRIITPEAFLELP
jgi:putative PIN family toxin of toxin-antitoxin system